MDWSTEVAEEVVELLKDSYFIETIDSDDEWELQQKIREIVVRCHETADDPEEF